MSPFDVWMLVVVIGAFGALGGYCMGRPAHEWQRQQRVAGLLVLLLMAVGLATVAAAAVAYAETI